MTSAPLRITLRLSPDDAHLLERVKALAPQFAEPGIPVTLNSALVFILRIGIDAAEAKYPPRPSTESP